MRLIFIGLVALPLMGCATLNESQCQRGDWQSIGFADGAAGRTSAYVERHREACAEFGITPDLSRWLQGREEGLRLYCTPDSAYRVGREGAALSPVCAPEQLVAMQPAYAHGRRYDSLTDDIRDAERRERLIEEELRSLEPWKDTEGVVGRRSALLRDLARLRLEIQRLELRRLAYARWP